MPWVEVFVVFVVSHLTGDFLLQTEWQALHKFGGLGPDPERRRALIAHATSYTLAFVPALVWLADDLGVRVLAVAAAIGIPHFIQDDGRLVLAYFRRVKKCPARPGDPLFVYVDQSFHLVALFVVALVAGT